MTRRVVAYSAYGEAGASTRVRLYDWFDYVGLDVERHEYLGRSRNQPHDLARRPLAVARAEWALRGPVSSAADVLLVGREASPLSNGGIESKLLRRAARGVFDFDDAIFLPTGGVRDRINQAAKVERMIQAADVVIAGNERLADWALGYSDAVVVIPSCVDPDLYRPKATWELGDPPKLIWLGSPATEHYVVDMAAELERVWQETGAQLVVVSADLDTPQELDRWSHFVRRVEWTPSVAQTLLADADIGLAPLRDDPYARGKCAYKLVQYAAAALPIVGSPVGANALAIERFDGVAVERRAHWAEALIGLLKEPVSRRRSRGQVAREAVRAQYSFEAWAEKWTGTVLGLDD